MFILPPNCIVPSATSLTISPVFPNFRYFISHTPSAANEIAIGGVETVFLQHHRLARKRGHPALPLRIDCTVWPPQATASRRRQAILHLGGAAAITWRFAIVSFATRRRCLRPAAKAVCAIKESLR